LRPRRDGHLARQSTRSRFSIRRGCAAEAWDELCVIGATMTCAMTKSYWGRNHILREPLFDTS
jgi:hypothetical protein